MNPTLRRILLNRVFWLVVLLAFMALGFSNGLSAGIKGGISVQLSICALSGAAMGYYFARSRLPALVAGLLIILVGLFGILFYTAQLFEPLIQLESALNSIRDQLFAWIRWRTVLPDIAVLGPPVKDLMERSIALFVRVRFWLHGLPTGAIMNDPVSRAVSWSVSVYVLSSWAGWVLSRYRNPLVAFTPMIAVLAIVVDYTGEGFNVLWLMLAITMILLGLSRFDLNLLRWRNFGVDFSESIPVDTGSAIAILTIALAAIAWITPSISVKAMAEAIRDWGRSQEELAESFGLEPAPPPPSGFAPYLSPKELPRSHLVGSGPELSKQLVMAIRTGELPPRPLISNPPPAPRHYWRSIVYDRYTGSGWLSSPVEVYAYDNGEHTIESVPNSYHFINQNIEFYKDTSGQLSWTGYLISVDQPYKVAWRHRPTSLIKNDPFNGMDYLGAISPVKSYNATSVEVVVSEEELRNSNPSYPPFIMKYLELPETTPERVHSLARDITANQSTPYDRAIAIEAYLRENYPYSLDVPAPPDGKDVADFFLFDLKKGYCDYYATAMVVLARAAGLPARFVSGYASGTYDSANAEYIVSEANAHSWVEVFFTDIGWVEFEPTAGLPPIDRLDQPLIQNPLFDNTEAITIDLKDQIINMLILTGIYVGSALAIFFIGYFAFIWLESAWLYIQPTNTSLDYIFRKLKKQGSKVAGKGTGETPFEFAFRLKSHFHPKHNQKIPFVSSDKSIYAIELITDTYVHSVYSTHQIPRDKKIEAINFWRGLRVQLIIVRAHK